MPGLIAEHGERFARPGNLVSNGAYTLERWTLGSSLTASATRSTGTMRKPRSMWFAITLRRSRVTNSIATWPASCDITSTVPSEAFERLQEERPDELRVAPTLSVYYYGFNHDAPGTGDQPKLREALSMAIDRESLARKWSHAARARPTVSCRPAPTTTRRRSFIMRP